MLPRRTASGMLWLQSLANSIWPHFRHFEQYSCGSFGISSSLFPISQRPRADAYDLGKLRLAHMPFTANFLYLERVKVKNPGWLPLAGTDLIHLLDTFQQLLKISILHRVLS